MAPTDTRHRYSSQILTHTAETLLAETHQHVEAQIAVRRLAEVLQAPHVDAILLQRGAVDTWGRLRCRD